MVHWGVTSLPFVMQKTVPKVVLVLVRSVKTIILWVGNKNLKSDYFKVESRFWQMNLTCRNLILKFCFWNVLLRDSFILQLEEKNISPLNKEPWIFRETREMWLMAFTNLKTTKDIISKRAFSHVCPLCPNWQFGDKLFDWKKRVRRR